MSAKDEDPIEGSLTEEAFVDDLERALARLMTPVVDGVYAVVEATAVRRDRYLNDSDGDVRAATEAAIAYRATKTDRLRPFLVGLLPGLSIPGRIVVALWNRMRAIALVASLHGFDASDVEIQREVLCCLVDADLSLERRIDTDDASRFVARELIRRASASSAKGREAKRISFQRIHDILTADEGAHARVRFRAKADKRKGNALLERVQQSLVSSKEQLEPEDQLLLLEQAKDLFTSANKSDLVREAEKLEKSIQNQKRVVSSRTSFSIGRAFIDFIFGVFRGIIDVLRHLLVRSSPNK